MKLLFEDFFFFFVIPSTIQRSSSADDPRRHEGIGVLVEMCGPVEGIVDVLGLSKRLDDTVFAVPCREYLQAANAVGRLATTNGFAGIVVVAPRKTLAILRSTVVISGLKYWFIATDNDWTLARPFRYYDEADDQSQTWNMVTALLPDIIDRWQWRNLYLYVDEAFGLDEARLVYSRFEAYQDVANIKLIKTPQLMSPVDFLKTVREMDNRGSHEVKAVVVVGNPELAQRVAREASKMAMFSYYTRWLFLEMGSVDFLKSLRLRVDTDVILMRHQGAAAGFNGLIAKSFERAINLLQKGDASNSSSDDEPDLPMELVRVIPRRTGVHRLRGIGQWSLADGLTEMKTEDFPDLESFELIVATIDCPPYVSVGYDNGSLNFQGYMVDILDALSELMNFRYQMYVPDDATYGRCVNATCSGLVGTMVRGDADVALANMAPNPERLELVDFATVAVDEGGLSLIMKRPKKSDANAINAYLKPFSWSVALLISVTVPLFGCLLWLGYRVAEVAQNGHVDCDGKQEQLDPLRARMNTDNRAPMRCLFAAMQSFAQQGVDAIPVTPSARTIFGVMWLFSVFIMSAYTANLISYFTANTVDWPFKSLEELFKNRYYTVGLVDGTTYLDDIQGDNRSVLTKVWNRMKKGEFSALVESFEAGKERVRKGRYVLLHEAGVIEHVVAKTCVFMSINEKYLSGPLTLVFGKDSEFTRPFSQMLLRISESGLLVKLKRRWWPPAYDCSRERSFEGISLWAATSILSVLASGIFVSVLSFAVEKCVGAAKARKIAAGNLLRRLGIGDADGMAGLP